MTNVSCNLLVLFVSEAVGNHEIENVSSASCHAVGHLMSMVFLSSSYWKMFEKVKMLGDAVGTYE